MGPQERKDAGNRLFQEGKWQLAADEYTAGLQECGDDSASDQRGLLLSNRSQCWLKLNDYEKSYKDADDCLKLLPEHSKSLFRRALAQEKLGRSSEALADFAKVARVEPNNKAAVEATQRLRDQVFQRNQDRADEALPSKLLETLRSGGKEEEQLEACSRLRQLCLQRGQARLLLSAGALPLLLESSSALERPWELRQAYLSCLVAIVCGQEDLDSTASNSSPVPAAAAEARKEVREALGPNSETFARLRSCRGHAASMRELVKLLGFCYEPEDQHALEVIDMGISFIEGSDVDVPRAAVAALVNICDRRRRLGSSGKAVVPNSALEKCLESALGTSCGELLSTLFAEVFALLADEDRPKDQQVDLSAVGLRVLEPFLQSEDLNLRSNGLAGLCCLLTASAKAAVLLLQQSSAPLAAVLGSLSQPSPGPEGVTAQHYAAECLLLATQDQKIRQHWIDGGGIDVLLNALNNQSAGSNRGLVHAKLVAALSIVAAHSKEVRDEVFDRIDFMMELRYALDEARNSLKSADSEQKTKQARSLVNGLYESCSCLSIHGEFKELLAGSKKTLAALQSLASNADLADSPNLAFLFASLIYNLCRSREDKVRKKKGDGMLDDLGDEDLKALEEFYEKMPAESRPVQNGQVDCGSKDLAMSLQSWLLQPANGAAAVVGQLGKCVLKGSMQTKALVAMTIKMLCSEADGRRFIVAAGGIRTLLLLVDLQEAAPRDAARQALAQLCIVTNPEFLQYSEQLDAVRPLTELLEHRHELLQFEGAMGLTNLLGASEELRARALASDAWRRCRDLLFSENEQVQRAGLEAMCNLTMAEEVLGRFADGRAEMELKVFGSFCNVADEGSAVAASGALAMLASCPEAAAKMVACENCLEGILQAALESDFPSVQHRAVSAACHIYELKDCPEKSALAVKAVLQERMRRGGFRSSEAQEIAVSVLKG